MHTAHNAWPGLNRREKFNNSPTLYSVKRRHFVDREGSFMMGFIFIHRKKLLDRLRVNAEWTAKLKNGRKK